MKTLSIFVCGLLGFGCGADASAASYDCSKASTIIEKTICNDAELSSLDEMMAARYRPWLQGQSDKEKARSEQRKWLKFRDQCVTYQSPTRQSCLKSAYEERISFLASTPVESGDVHVPTLASPESANLESASKVKPAASAIDKAAASAAAANEDAIAVIVGNAGYAPGIPGVDYAHRDAEAMRRFVVDGLGYREGNVFVLRDATLGGLTTWFGSDTDPKGKLFLALRPEESDVFVYYSGHGVPGPADGRGRRHAQ